MWWFSETDTNSYACWRANRLIDRSLCVKLNESNHFIKNDEDWNLLKKRAFRRLQVDFASFQWWAKVRLTCKTLKKHYIRYECWRYVNHSNRALMCTCLMKRNRSINYWFSVLCWHKNIFERFFFISYKKWKSIKNELYDVKTQTLRQNFWIVNISYFLIWKFVNKEIMISFLLFFTMYFNIEKMIFFIILLNFEYSACSNCFDNCLLSICWMIFSNATTIWICIETKQKR
jgi:hypothetical protein